MPDKIGEQFQQQTKAVRDAVAASHVEEARPPLYKEYPDSRKIALPPPGHAADMPLDQTLRLRRSVRQYTEDAVSLADLSYLLWAATGLQRNERSRDFRTAPSAGAQYPIETYVIANNVQGLAAGVYHYAVKDHLLEELRAGDISEELAHAAMEQAKCKQAPLVLVWTAIFQRTRWRYMQRAYRYIYLDAGHIAQNLALSATAMGYGTCQIAAVFDDEVNALVGVDGVAESVVYMSSVGRPG